MALIRKLNKIFDRNVKIKLLILLIAIIIGGFLEMFALSLISPFIAVLLDNTMLYTNPYLNWVYELFGFRSVNVFLGTMAFMLATVYIVRGVYSFILNRAKIRFVANRQAFFSQKLLKKVLGFSYLYHTNRNVAELKRIISQDVVEMFGMINGLLSFATDFIMSLFILGLLLATSPVMTLCVLLLALICVFLYFKAFRKKIRKLGVKNREAAIGVNKAVLQALGGIKEIKVLHREKYFQNAFKINNNIAVKTKTQYRTLDLVPKIAIELICFGGAFVMLGAFIISGADVAGLVPQLSLFVLAAFRLLPAISRQVNSINTVLYNKASVDAVYKSLFEEADISATVSEKYLDSKCGSGEDIVINDLTFQYPCTAEAVLEGVTFSIPKNKSVAFVGPSGAGKTTLADLILGILTPDEGGVYYEGKSIHLHFDEWSQSVGYIPQQIYLLDESILANVAFGIDPDKIEEEKVWRALEQAQLKEFVESLPEGINTVVGDRGVRLSGGQRQRIGIARAMYENPPILVLDEATSSLDTETEKAVMDAIIGFHGNKTIIIVAHRLSTIEHCDIVFRVEDKKVTRDW